MPDDTDAFTPPQIDADPPVVALARLVGLQLPAEDLEPLTLSLRRLAVGVQPMLAAVAGRAIAVPFDPSW